MVIGLLQPPPEAYNWQQVHHKLNIAKKQSVRERVMRRRCAMCTASMGFPRIPKLPIGQKHY